MLLLFYVSVIVPLRAGFKARCCNNQHGCSPPLVMFALRAVCARQMDTALWSFAFIFDACVDIYFIADLALNFRTAYYRRDGTREERPRRIAVHYLSGWFSVDFFSCLPVSYIEYFMVVSTEEVLVGSNGTVASVGGADNSGSNFKGVKMLRLVRLSKML